MFKIVRKDHKIQIFNQHATDTSPSYEFDDDFKLILPASHQSEAKVVKLSDLDDDTLLLALRAAGDI